MTKTVTFRVTFPLPEKVYDKNGKLCASSLDEETLDWWEGLPSEDQIAEQFKYHLESGKVGMVNYGSVTIDKVEIK